MSNHEAAELLDLIIDRASKLREVGIRGEVELAGVVRFTIGEEREDETGAAVTPATIGDPLDDPETYGLPPGSPLPGRRSEAKS